MFKYFYAPFLMKKWVRASVVIVFYGWLCSSLAVVPKIEIGLDQEILEKWLTTLELTMENVAYIGDDINDVVNCDSSSLTE